MLAWSGMLCNQYVSVVREIKAKRERIRLFPEDEAKAARAELNRPWAECSCPACGKAGTLTVYSFYAHPVDKLLTDCDGNVDFLRLKCSGCGRTHLFFR